MEYGGAIEYIHDAAAAAWAINNGKDTSEAAKKFSCHERNVRQILRTLPKGYPADIPGKTCRVFRHLLRQAGLTKVVYTKHELKMAIYIVLGYSESCLQSKQKYCSVAQAARDHGVPLRTLERKLSNLRQATQSSNIHELRLKAKAVNIPFLVNQEIARTHPGPDPYLTDNESSVSGVIMDRMNEVGLGFTLPKVKVGNSSE